MKALIAHIVLLGTPKAASLKKNKEGKIYNAKSVYMAACKWKVKIQYRKTAVAVPVVVDYFFGFPIPSSWPKDKQEKAREGGMPYTSRPDYDNLEKLYNDCIKGIVVKDDCYLQSGKWLEKYLHIQHSRLGILPMKQ